MAFLVEHQALFEVCDSFLMFSHVIIDDAAGIDEVDIFWIKGQGSLCQL